MADGRGRQIGEFPGPGRPAAEPGAVAFRPLPGAARPRGSRWHRRSAAAKGWSTPTESADGVAARFRRRQHRHRGCADRRRRHSLRVRTLIDPNAPGPDSFPLLNFGAMSSITVPARPDAMYFVFGKQAFLGYWTQPDGRTGWFSNLPDDTPMTIAQAREQSAEVWLRRLREVYADDVPGRELLAHTEPEDLLSFGSMEIMPQGAPLAQRPDGVGRRFRARSVVEFRVRALRWRSRAPSSSPSVCVTCPTRPAPSHGYEALRRPRVEKVAARAAKTNSGKALGPVATTMMSLLMPLALKTVMKPEKTLGAEQRFRIDWDETDQRVDGRHLAADHRQHRDAAHRRTRCRHHQLTVASSIGQLDGDRVDLRQRPQMRSTARDPLRPLRKRAHPLAQIGQPRTTRPVRSTRAPVRHPAGQPLVRFAPRSPAVTSARPSTSKPFLRSDRPSR